MVKKKTKRAKVRAAKPKPVVFQLTALIYVEPEIQFGDSVEKIRRDVLQHVVRYSSFDMRMVTLKAVTLKAVTP